MALVRRDLLKLFNAISIMEGRQFSVKFSYFIAKNKVAMRDEISALEEAKKPSDKYLEYDNARAQLAQEFSDKNDDGSSKIHDNSFVITARADEFHDKLDELKETYKDAINEFENKMKEFDELLSGNVEFEGSKLDFDDIPSTIEPSILETFILANLIVE